MKDKPTLVSILVTYLIEKRGEVVHGGQLEAVAKANSYEAEPAKVRLREMTRETCRQFTPMIEKLKLKDGCVAYRYWQELEDVPIVPEPVLPVMSDAAPATLFL